MKFTRILACAVLALFPVSVAADTVCNRNTFSGQWRGIDADVLCDLNVNRQGQVTGTCGEVNVNYQTGQERYVEFAITGRVFIQRNCAIRIVLSAGSESFTLFGRVWGTAGSSPDAGIASTRRGLDQFALAFYRS